MFGSKLTDQLGVTISHRAVGRSIQHGFRGGGGGCVALTYPFYKYIRNILLGFRISLSSVVNNCVVSKRVLEFLLSTLPQRHTSDIAVLTQETDADVTCPPLTTHDHLVVT